VAATSGGGEFPGRPGSRKEFMKGKSFPPTDRARLAARCAVEVPLMLRYFTGKLFKSNILPAVIKYKLHRASWAGRGEGRGGRGEMRRGQSIVHRRGCGTPDAP
jgi:hypothetical protein